MTTAMKTVSVLLAMMNRADPDCAIIPTGQSAPARADTGMVPADHRTSLFESPSR
jgi:hypothetical protein